MERRKKEILVYIIDTDVRISGWQGKLIIWKKTSQKHFSINTLRRWSVLKFQDMQKRWLNMH